MRGQAFITRLRIALGLLAFAGTAWGQGADFIIGQTLSLTGPSAAIAHELLRGRQACVDLVNAQGGVRGRPLRLLTRDDQGDPARAVQLARELAEHDGAVALLGAMGPAVNGPVLQWAGGAGMAVVGPFGGEVESRLQGAETAYFLTANQSAEAERLAAHVVSLGFTRVVIVHGTDKAGRAALTALEEGLGTSNVSAVALVAVQPDGSNARAAAQQASAQNPQAVLLATSGKATVAVLRELASPTLGGPPLLQVYGLSSAASLAELTELGPRARGFSMSQVIPSPRDARLPVVATFLEALRNAPGERTPVELEGCMAPLLVAEVLRRKPVEPGRAAVLQAMRAAGRVSLGGFDVDLADHAKLGSRFTDIVHIGAGGKVIR